MDARKAKSRAAIVAAFSELLREEDYGKIAVGDIIARAHVGRATFYGLFKSKDDLLAEFVCDICTHALDDDGTPLNDPLVQVEHILNNLWDRRQGVRALVAGAGSRVFADCLRKTIMSRAAETVPVDPAGPASTMDRNFLLHHIASSFVATVQWWAWHNFQADKADVAKDYLSAIKPLFTKVRGSSQSIAPTQGARASQRVARTSTPPNSDKPLPSKFRNMLGCLYERNKDPAAVRMG
ncbi:MAG: TetR/AcrR family transcriptional regulator [Collinsella sp.]|nr:TetR/AcrR family transcriptional regulator [Collinsella sp.]